MGSLTATSMQLLAAEGPNTKMQSGQHGALGMEFGASPSVKHEQEALAAAGLGRLQAPLLGALRQGAIPPARCPVHAHLLLQAHVPQLLHKHLRSACMAN